MTATSNPPGRITIINATLMTAVGGYVDAFLYLRHHVFGFAQTGNVIFLATSLVQGQDWAKFAWPLLAYLAGLVVAQLPRTRASGVTPAVVGAALGLQLLVLVVLASVPRDAPTALLVVPLSFVGGIRLELFRSASGISFVSIAATGNLMRFVEAVADLSRSRSSAALRSVAFTTAVVVGFLGGGLCGAAATKTFGSALWGAVILETASFAVFAFNVRRDGLRAVDTSSEPDPQPQSARPGERNDL